MCEGGRAQRRRSIDLRLDHEQEAGGGDRCAGAERKDREVEAFALLPSCGTVKGVPLSNQWYQHNTLLCCLDSRAAASLTLLDYSKV